MPFTNLQDIEFFVSQPASLGQHLADLFFSNHPAIYNYIALPPAMQHFKPYILLENLGKRIGLYAAKRNDTLMIVTPHVLRVDGDELTLEFERVGQPPDDDLWKLELEAKGDVLKPEVLAWLERQKWEVIRKSDYSTE